MFRFFPVVVLVLLSGAWDCLHIRQNPFLGFQLNPVFLPSYPLPRGEVWLVLEMTSFSVFVRISLRFRRTDSLA